MQNNSKKNDWWGEDEPLPQQIINTKFNDEISSDNESSDYNDLDSNDSNDSSKDISNVNKLEGEDNFIEELSNIIKKTYFKCNNLNISFNSKNNVNMCTNNYYINNYGYFGIVLKKIELYLYNNKKIINISKLRNDIDITSEKLKNLLTTNDYHLQEKLCIKLTEQKKNLADSYNYLLLEKEKKTDIDLIRKANNILKKNNDKSFKLCQSVKKHLV
jgi:hypothetical protein